jgi:putative transposase
MPRQPRFFYSGAVLHVVQRGNNRAPVFTCAADHRFYLDCLRDASRTHEVSIHAYVLMTNHVHILASPAHERALPRMMQSVGRRYVGRFNFVQGRTGTLWEGRYKATLVDTEAYLFSCLRYIELNPVRAHMVAAPGDYRWSSHGANAFGNDDSVITPHPSFLASGSTNEERRDTYRRMFAEPLHAETIQAIRDATQFEWALGDAAFRAVVETRARRRADRLPKGRPVTRDGAKSRL